jgi:hypothetical protein
MRGGSRAFAVIYCWGFALVCQRATSTPLRTVVYPKKQPSDKCGPTTANG